MLHISPEEQKAAAAGPARRPDQALEVQPRRPRRAGALGATTRRRTRSPWSAPTPRPRPGTSSRRTGSGTATCAVGKLLLETLRGIDPQWPAPTSTSSRAAATAREDRARCRSRVIETVAVTRYVTPLREGGSLPGIVEADDLGTYVCKFRGAGQGLRVLVAEVIVSGLAHRLGLCDAAAGRARPRPGDRPLRGRRGGPGPAQRQPRTQPRRRLPARRVRLRRRAGDAADPVGARDALARRLHRQRRPHLAQPQPAASGTATSG